MAKSHDKKAKGQEANIPEANCKKIPAKADVKEAIDREISGLTNKSKQYRDARQSG